MPGVSEWNFEANYLTRYRIYRFMEVMGLSLGESPYYSYGARAAFRYYFRELFGNTVNNMPIYPYSGYISYLKDEEAGLEYLIVKLGNNWEDCFNWDADIN